MRVLSFLSLSRTWTLNPKTKQNKTPPTLQLQLYQTQHGAAATIARDLQQKLAALQKAGAALDSAWRMAVVRQPPSARDLWKR